jgi:protein CpxP
LMPAVLYAQSSDNQSNGQAQSDSSEKTNDTQPHRGRRMRHGRSGQGMGWLAQKLNLTDQQKQQFRDIHQKSMEQARAVRNDSSLSADQKRDKMRELRKQQHQQMFSVLTPEQKDQLKQLREQRKKQMQEKGKASGDQASAKNGGKQADDDDPFAGMTSDDDEGPGNGF